MFSINTDAPKKYRESIKYLDRHSLLKMSHEGNIAYLLGDQAFLVTDDQTVEYSTTGSILYMYMTVLIDLFRK